ncbi:hypothetical protein GCM10010381_24530 [Streptomyces xantholiticus]|nr:hypothetical protein GCM10010381_24530 [Streptomyces xantholiticus]
MAAPAGVPAAHRGTYRVGCHEPDEPDRACGGHGGGARQHTEQEEPEARACRSPAELSRGVLVERPQLQLPTPYGRPGGAHHEQRPREQRVGQGPPAGWIRKAR